MRRRVRPTGVARRDVLVLATLLGAVILLIWNGRLLLHEVNLVGLTFPDGARIAGTAVALNAALILLGWRRYAELNRETRLRADTAARAAVIATTDPLTGLLNRRGFADHAGMLALQARIGAWRVAIFSVQLKRFKGINDRYGFDIGDELLRRIASGIGEALDPGAAVARLSGDEFAIAIAQPVEDRNRLELTAGSVLRSITRPQDVDGKIIQVGASLGIALSDGSATGVAALLRRADIALDHAKTARATSPVWFDEGMEQALLAHGEIEQGIRIGVEKGQFEPYFEPQVDLATGAIIGFEVLARWQHPASGLIMPDVFIPVAEEIGLIGRLSEQVMLSAFATAVTWDPAITLSVNVSPSQLTDSWLAQRIVRLLAKTGFPANRLVVEITESSLFADIDQARVIVTSLQNQGIRLALDDFGTGFSSLSHLRSLPFDVIKIDRSFVATIERDRESAAIVTAVASLATAIGVPVTAEGIEDAATLQAVVGMGCAVGQGWYFGKPTGAEEAARLLDDQRAGQGQAPRLRLVGNAG